MSEIHDSTAAVPTSVEQPTTAPATTENFTSGEAPVATEPSPQHTTETTAAHENTAAPVTETFESQAADPADKKIEPITEGQLTYKGPGLLKSLIPSKKEFWLTDEVDPLLDLSSFIRGEKREIGASVGAWAGQTWKGLLFFNKKGDHNRQKPDTILPLYEATELRKQAPHEISFFIKPNHYTLKAASDAERDGWYMSIEKSMELGKACKDEVEFSDGYKARLGELNKADLGTAPAGPGGYTPHDHHEKKSSDVGRNDENTQPKPEAKESKKNRKSRSTSRGVLDRLRNKKDEREQKKDDKDATKEETKRDHEAEAAAVGAGVAAAGCAAIAHEEQNKPTPEEGAPTQEPKTEEKPKPTKRSSIFGSLFKGQQKDKDQKEAEPVSETKDGVVVADSPPQLPEATTAADKVDEPAATEAPAPLVATAATAEPKLEAEAKPEEPKEEVATPNKEKKTFLSNFGFMRGRSVSPSAQPKDAPVKDEVAPDEPTEVTKTTDEPSGEPAVPTVMPVAVPADAVAADEKTEETPKTETLTGNKRQSIMSSIGRRASQAFKGKSTPKKDASKTTEETHAVAAPETTTANETLATSEPTDAISTQPQPHIGDVVPEAVHVGSPQETNPTVASASA